MAAKAIFDGVEEALSRSLRVPPTATPREVRTNGAICAAVGFLLLVACGVGIFTIGAVHVPRAVGLVALAVLLVAYGLFIIGTYRAITGKNPANDSYTATSSLARILAGVGIVVVAAGLLLAIMIAVLALLGIK